MTDIVERLRNTIHVFEPPMSAINAMEDAADEIERLRAALRLIIDMSFDPQNDFAKVARAALEGK